MIIETGKTSGYLKCTVKIGNTTIELDLMDYDEAINFREILGQALSEVDWYINSYR